ncbi:MAG: NADH-quinone oxidoreductase subunit L [Deltaproteobacteria bacterium]|nr:NADH-quinone oxidoreductase subunit L [Deltaproteobacteria bacterium]
MSSYLIYVALLSPFLGFLIQIFLGGKLSKTISGTISSLAVFVSFLASLFLFFEFHNVSFSHTLFSWFDIGDFKADFSVKIDQLSLLMMLVVTGISTLIHIYSTGYMHEDPLFSRYFGYLNLFVFMMLTLIMADNLLLMFVGWEGVGLCSYLLIGFWFEDDFKAFCGKKAFIVNRIGDAAFILGIFLIFSLFGTLEFESLYTSTLNRSPEMGFGLLSCITLFLFIGATGKSAQIPLYVWLPDAMAGPTPVSALIHAATMVTAGVYMICRLSFFYDLTPIVQNIIIVIGMATAILSGLIALTQKDIKKVLAYSTVSQLGYMFVAAGLAAYGAAMFHLTTHAFFKALLFLCSGSVIHAMNGEQDMFKMGGLKNVMPITYLSFLVGALALSGIPPLAGFFSKDTILAFAFAKSPLLWGLTAFTALLTSFYIFRALSLTFHGKLGNIHAHESPSSMTVPLVLLSCGTLLVGFLGLPPMFSHLFHVENLFEKFLGWESSLHLSGQTEWFLMGACSALVILTAYTATKLFSGDKAKVTALKNKFSKLHTLSENKFYVDEFYDLVFVKTAHKKAQFFWEKIDIFVIDGIVNGVGSLGRNLSILLSLIQTGRVINYAFMMFLGMILILLYLVKL